MVLAHGVDDERRCKSVGQQRVFRVIVLQPRHDFLCLRMEQEFATFEAYDRATCDALALHDGFDFVESEILAHGVGIEHQLREPFVARAQRIVQIEQAVEEVVGYAIHVLILLK